MYHRFDCLLAAMWVLVQQGISGSSISECVLDIAMAIGRFTLY
jgi:hypothetical protein